MKTKKKQPALDVDRPRNIVFCRGCLEVLESTYCHDFVQCNCANRTFTDGGIDSGYTRFGGMDMSLVEVIESPEQ